MPGVVCKGHPPLTSLQDFPRPSSFQRSTGLGFQKLANNELFCIFLKEISIIVLSFRWVSYNTKAVTSKTKKAGIQRWKICLVPGSISSSTGMRHPADTHPQAGNSVRVLPGEAELRLKLCEPGQQAEKSLIVLPDALAWAGDSNTVLFSTCLKQKIWQRGAQSSSETGVVCQQVPVNLSGTQAGEAVCQDPIANTCGRTRNTLS